MEPPEVDDVLAIGVDLSVEERSILCLPPETSLNLSLSEVEFETNVDVSFAKARYSLRDELDKEDGESSTWTLGRRTRTWRRRSGRWRPGPGWCTTTECEHWT